MSDFLVGLGALGTGLASLGNVALGGLNYNSQLANLDYQKELQQKIFQREDTALQRRMSDAKSAGLNPYSVINSGGAGAGSVVSTKAPQANMNLNGVIDTINSILDIKQRQAQTQGLLADNANKAKEGLILDSKLIGSDWQNKILGNQSNLLRFDLNDRLLDSMRHQAEFNYDFGTKVKYRKGENNAFDYSSPWYDVNNFPEFLGVKHGYDEPSPWYKRQVAKDETSNINYYQLLDYWNSYYSKDMKNYYGMQDLQKQLLEKQNNWYNWNQGFNMIDKTIDTATGLLFKGLDFGLKRR